MASNGSEIKEILANENTDFRRLYDTHRGYDSRLQQLSSRPYLSAQEELEISELKKKKLILKDQMHQMMEQFKDNRS